jgi:hypothetical protein
VFYIYIKIPKDVVAVKNKVFLGMDKRELFIIVPALIISLIFTIFIFGNIFPLIIFLIPACFLAFYKQNSQTAEQLIKKIMRQKLQRKEIRVYRTSNYYNSLFNESKGKSSRERGIADGKKAKPR